MKQIKKLFVLLTALSALLLCAACGAEEEQEPDTQQGIEEPQAPDTVEEADFDPYSPEFSLKSDSGMLQLGEQSGEFPWESGLTAQNISYVSMDGFHSAKILCTDGTVLGGLRQKNVESTNDLLLTDVETGSQMFVTYRGAAVGMTLEEVLALYPEAREFELEPSKAGAAGYVFSGEQYGMTCMEFLFQDGVLTGIHMYNEVC